MTMMRINRRIVNVKRHTVGYVLSGGRQVTRKEAIGLAKTGALAGVRIVNGPKGKYLQSTGKRNIHELPETRQSVTNS